MSSSFTCDPTPQEQSTQALPETQGQSRPANQEQHDAAVSPQKVAANRRNAQRSPGPKTPEGKRRSSRNAVQHGILARQALVAVGDGREDLGEFNEMLQQLREFYQPDNIQDDLDVEELAIGYLGKARAARAEMGEIRSSLDTIRRDEYRWRAKAIESTKQDLATGMSSDAFSSKIEIPQSREGMDFLLELLDRVEENIRRKNRYASPHDPAVDALEQLGIRIRNLSKTEVLEKIGSLKRELTDQRSEIAEIAELKLEARIATLALPSSDVVNKILRYTTAIDRRLQKIRDRLEKRGSDRERSAGSAGNGGGSS